jgi:hypothetical protein
VDSKSGTGPQAANASRRSVVAEVTRSRSRRRLGRISRNHAGSLHLGPFPLIGAIPWLAAAESAVGLARPPCDAL